MRAVDVPLNIKSLDLQDLLDCLKCTTVYAFTYTLHEAKKNYMKLKYSMKDKVVCVYTAVQYVRVYTKRHQEIYFWCCIP